jgi:bifunctional ADP-heptose synthase (sugar kinase/adenylyltransferase)
MNLLELIGNDHKCKIKYLLPKFNNPNYTSEIPFDLNRLYDDSLRSIYNKYNFDYFHIINMQPIDFLCDVIRPTVKVRFYSEENKKVYYRLDSDNNVNMRNINCTHMFSKEADNNLILIDYNKGYLNKNTIHTLYDYLVNNGITFKKVFLNTKPSQLQYYKDLLSYLVIDAEVTIQLNEFEFEPIKDVIFDEYLWNNLVVTRGTKAVHLYKACINQYVAYDIDKIYMDDMYTTSGCGDIFLANIIYNMIYNDSTIEESLVNIDRVKSLLIRLNNDLFNLW